MLHNEVTHTNMTDKATNIPPNNKDEESILRITPESTYSNPYFDWIPEVMRLPDLNSIQKIVLGMVIKLQSRELGYCNAKNDYFATETGMSVRSIEDVFSVLKSKRYLVWPSPKTERDSNGHLFKKRTIHLSSKTINLLNSPTTEKRSPPTPESCGYSTFGTRGVSEIKKVKSVKRVKKVKPSTPNWGREV